MQNLHNSDQLIFERLHAVEAEREQMRRVARLNKARPSRMRHLLGSLGTIFRPNRDKTATE